MTDNVKDLFQREVENFVVRYQNPTLIDRFLRQSIFRRFEETLAECRKHGYKHVLDIGSGAGLQAMMLANAGLNVRGVDISENMVRKAKAIAQTDFLQKDAGVVDFMVSDLMDFNPDRTFDLVMALGVFDYIHDPRTYLSKMKALASREVIASFPSSSDVLFLQRKIRYKYMKKCDIYSYSLKTLEGLAEACGFRDFKVKNIGRDYLFCGYIEG